MILFTGQKHSFWYKHCWWWNEKEKTWRIQELWVCLYMFHRKCLMWCDCVILVTKNYILDNPNVADALSRRYREVRNKEFICKPCHTKLQHGHFSKVNSNDVEHSENVVVMNSNDMTQLLEFHMTSPDFTQNPKYTNHCICSCYHKLDLTRSQCIIFKASRYNFDNTVVSKALSNHIVASTTKEFICKNVINHVDVGFSRQAYLSSKLFILLLRKLFDTWLIIVGWKNACWCQM